MKLICYWLSADIADGLHPAVGLKCERFTPPGNLAA
jgi:hypothetical protein